jgi:HTH-type transcriptional regulator/antitoxin HigA
MPTAGKRHASADVWRGEIRSEAELDKATHRLCALLSLNRRPTRAEDAEIRLLTDAVEAYEDQHHPIPEPTAAALLSHLLEARDASPARLASATGIAVQDISAILSGLRGITRTESGAFAKFFHLDESVFDVPAPSVTIKVVGTPYEPAGIHVQGGLPVAKWKALVHQIVDAVFWSGHPSPPAGAVQTFESRSETACV